jgi:hypothetical protein
MAAGPVETVRIKPDAWPDLTAREVDVYTDAQIPYPNLAKNDVIARRALNFAMAVRRKWEGETSEIRENWNAISWLFHANSLSRGTGTSVHVPEVLSFHRSILPRIVEAYIGSGRDWFRAEGVDADDRMRDASVTAFLESQLAQNRFTEKLVPGVNTALKNDVICFKVTWERNKRQQWYHWIEKDKDSKGNPVEIHKRQKREIGYEGNKIRLVDPHRLIVDAHKWDVDELDYIGDFSTMALDEVMRQDKRYVNLDVLRDSHLKGAVATDIGALTPSQAARSNLVRNTEGRPDTPPQPGGRKPVEMLEIWGWFDFSPEEAGATQDMREAVVVIADNSIVLEVRENFYDDKHRPYAIGRTSDNGFEFYDVGLYTPALRTQEEIDHFRSTVYEAADNIVTPRLAVSGPAPDLPASLYDLPAGSVIKDTGGAQWMPVPNNLQYVPVIDAMMRRTMEEVIGAPRFWQASDSGGANASGTLGEFQHLAEEGNRRLLGLITAVDSSCVRMLQIMHANNQQFVTEKTKFRILNKRWAKMLQGREGEIKPSELMHSVDFVIHGVRRIQSYGLRGTHLLTFFQVLQPILAERPDLVELPNLVRQIYNIMVGEQSDDEIIRPRTSFEDLEDQASENRRLRTGQRVPVDAMDDDREHIATMMQEGILDWAKGLPESNPAKFETFQHLANHINNAQKKEAQQQALQQDVQRRQSMMPQADEETAPAAGGLERGEKQTNGPGVPGQTPKAGRQSPIEQTRNGTNGSPA